jgi:hypothetical protein
VLCEEDRGATSCRSPLFAPWTREEILGQAARYSSHPGRWLILFRDRNSQAESASGGGVDGIGLEDVRGATARQTFTQCRERSASGLAAAGDVCGP